MLGRSVAIAVCALMLVSVASAGTITAYGLTDTKPGGWTAWDWVYELTISGEGRNGFTVEFADDQVTDAMVDDGTSGGWGAATWSSAGGHSQLKWSGAMVTSGTYYFAIDDADGGPALMEFTGWEYTDNALPPPDIGEEANGPAPYVPEPGAMALFAVGLGLMGLRRRLA